MLTKDKEPEKPKNRGHFVSGCRFILRIEGRGTVKRDIFPCVAGVASPATVPNLDSRAPVGPSAASRGGAKEGRAGTTDRSQPSLQRCGQSFLLPSSPPLHGVSRYTTRPETLFESRHWIGQRSQLLNPHGLGVYEFADAVLGQLAAVAAVLDAAERKPRITFGHLVDKRTAHL